LHWSFDDPSAARGTEPERLAVFRRVRDAIEARIVDWLREHAAVAGAASS
jgi:arsenate reductase